MQETKTSYEFYQTISIELLALREKLNKIIDSKEKSPKVCQDLTDEIDWVIVRLAQYTLGLKSKEPFFISRMKEFTWNLLERLEEYCINEIGISIW